MLAAIRQHLAVSAPFDAVRGEHKARHEVSTMAESLAAVEQERPLSLVERFCQALEAVSGRAIVVRSETEAAEAVRHILEQSGARRVAVSNSPLVRRVIECVTSDALLMENVAAPALFDCDVGITGAQWAVAETGTLVLESDRERHRLASLVPPVHIALVEADHMCETLGEVLQALNEHGPDGLSRTVTFVTGPSRTSDIELTLAIGVHGPGQIHVIVVEGEGGTHR
jgi:L-lactate dehydrogenase complex protein LldG